MGIGAAGFLRMRNVLLWVDPDLHARQSPSGWVQVRTAGEAIALLGEFSVHTISFYGAAEASAVIHWLPEQDAEGRDGCVPERIAFHGSDDPRAIDQLIAALEHDATARSASPYSSL